MAFDGFQEARNPYGVNVVFIGSHGFMHPNMKDSIVILYEFEAFSQTSTTNQEGKKISKEKVRLRFINISDMARMLRRSKNKVNILVSSACREIYKDDRIKVLNILIEQYARMPKDFKP
jgi:hypothetical protein